ncbi:hypothetical protein LTR64_002226 [Lithohypha guttulata]|uniref:uncharacterized protein n=1 Tax=Lithohypha guttulata TaxID=1690604 RepID=UPI002DDF5E48|nr:hypothetical protein LTR51_001547 [Lithohypha guttulata]
MEAKSLSDILDTVKQILSTASTVANLHAPQNAKPNTSILPGSIPPLPAHAENLPESTPPFQRTIDRLTQNILPYLNASSLSSRYYGFVTGGVTPAALIGDILTSIFDQNNAVHLPSESVGTIVEAAALNMLVDLFQLPKEEWEVGGEGSGGGVFTTGATATNILGLTLGREWVLTERVKEATGKEAGMSVGGHGLLAVAQAAGVDHVKVLSTLPHSSISKAAGVIGLGRSAVQSIVRTGSILDIDVEKLQSLAEDAEAERTAYILAISAGEVNTGLFATDSGHVMQQVREICDKYKIWIHVDGAMGLFARLLLNHFDTTNQYAKVTAGVKGLELADSIGADGHKLLNVPYDCGIFFTRHKKLSEEVFSNGNPAYLASTATDHVQNPFNIGLENSRRFRALPVYTTLSAYGREGYVDMLRRQIGLSRKIAAWLYDHEQYDLLPQGGSGSKEEAVAKIFMIVLFRAKDEEKNKGLVSRIKSDGRIYVSGSVWDGKPATRIAVSNWRVNVQEDGNIVQDVLEDVLS